MHPRPTLRAPIPFGTAAVVPYASASAGSRLESPTIAAEEIECETRGWISTLLSRLGVGGEDVGKDGDRMEIERGEDDGSWEEVSVSGRMGGMRVRRV